MNTTAEATRPRTQRRRFHPEPNHLILEQGPLPAAIKKASAAARAAYDELAAAAADLTEARGLAAETPVYSAEDVRSAEERWVQAREAAEQALSEQAAVVIQHRDAWLEAMKATVADHQAKIATLADQAYAAFDELRDEQERIRSLEGFSGTWYHWDRPIDGRPERTALRRQQRRERAEKQVSSLLGLRRGQTEIPCDIDHLAAALKALADDERGVV